MTNEAKLEVRSIEEVPAGTSFFVPAYQRGYRWGEVQVEALLTDFLESMRRQDDSYFLQPITLMVLEPGRFELIDGQQRLTTLFLLRHYLTWRYRLKSELFEELGRPPISEMSYTLTYQTRPNSAEFLRQLPENEPDSVDESFMHRAFSTIQAWAGEAEDGVWGIPLSARGDRDRPSEWSPGLHDWDRFIAHRVRLIWHEVDPDSNGKRLFLTLNRGRIALTNSELIKALLLSCVDEGLRGDASEKEAREVEITTQWDEMEQALHDPEFWAFLGGDARLGGQGDRPRMEYVFELLNPIQPGQDARNDYRTYVAYDRRIKVFRADPNPNKSDLGSFVRGELWRGEVRGAFLRLREWFNDSEYFHKIGFLIAVEDDAAALIGSLLALARGRSKADFIQEIDRRLVLAVRFGKETSLGWEFDDELVDRLRYGSSGSALTHLLLLHNCLYCWRPLWSRERGRRAERFSFRRDGERSRWSVEHINPQSEKRFLNPNSVFDEERARRWLRRHHPYLSLLRSGDAADAPTPLEQQVRVLLEKDTFQEPDFQPLRDAILRAFGRDFYDADEPTVDRIGNLALLGLAQNRELGDGIFAEKRQRVLQMVADGRFVPPCTRRLFLKAFIQPPGSDLRERSFAFWTRADAEDMRGEILRYLRLLAEGLVTPSHATEGDG